MRVTKVESQRRRKPPKDPNPFILSINARLKRNTHSALHNLSLHDFEKSSTNYINKQFNGSYAKAITVALPEHSWGAWNFKSTPQGWWRDTAARFTKCSDVIVDTAISEWLTDALGHSLEGSKPEQIQRELLNLGRANRNTRSIIADLGGPESITNRVLSHSLQPIASALPRNEGRAAQRRSPLASLRSKLERLVYPGDLSQLFTVDTSTIEVSNLWHYNKSFAMAVSTEFPEYCWHGWRFNTIPKNYWCYLAPLVMAGDPVALAALTDYLEFVQRKAKMGSLDDWYNVAPGTLTTELEPIENLGGLEVVLRLAYPFHPWSFPTDVLQDPSPQVVGRYRSKLASLPASHWTPPRTVEYLRFLKRSLSNGTSHLDPKHYASMYGLLRAHMTMSGGWALLHKGRSIPAIVTKAFPRHRWVAWKFVDNPLRWQQMKHDPAAAPYLKKLLEFIANQLNVTSAEQWQKADLRSATEMTRQAAHQVGGLDELLRRFLPEGSLRHSPEDSQAMLAKRSFSLFRS